jgi:hypothetical protein
MDCCVTQLSSIIGRGNRPFLYPKSLTLIENTVCVCCPLSVTFDFEKSSVIRDKNFQASSHSSKIRFVFLIEYKLKYLRKFAQ